MNSEIFCWECVTASVVYYSPNYEFIISSNAEMVYGVAAHGEMNFYLREISPFFPGNFNLGCEKPHDELRR